MISEKERKQKWIFVNIIISATIFSVFSIPHAHLGNICITSCSHHIINTLHTDIPQLMMGFSSVQFSCSVMSDSLLLHGLQNARIPVQLLALAQTHVHWVSDVIQPSCRLWSLLFLHSFFPSIRVFSKESALHIRWPKYWDLSFSISPSSGHSVSISFRTDWFNLHAAQGTLKSPPQHQNSKASILQCSAFFMV